MSSYRTTHWLIRAVGYEALLHAERRALHSNVAAAMEARLPIREGGVGPPSSDELVESLLSNRDVPTALLAAAGDIATHLAASLEGNSGAVARRRAGIFFVLWSLRMEGECAYPAAVSAARTSLRYLDGGSAGGCLAAAFLARALRRTGRMEEAGGVLVPALAVARSLTDRRPEAECLFGLGWVHSERGLFVEAEGRFAEARELARATGSARLHALAQQGIAGALLDRGDFPAAEQRYVEAHREAIETGQRRLTAICLQGLAGVRLAQGDLREAGSLYEAAREILRGIGDMRQAAGCLQGLGWVAMEEGRLSEAEAVLSEGHRAAGEIGESRLGAFLLNALATVFAERGRFRESLDLYRESQSLALGLGDRRLRAFCLQGMGVVLVALGDLDEARRSLDESHRIAGDIGDLRLRCGCIQRLGWVAEAQGDAAVAERLYAEAAIGLESVGAEGELAAVLAQRAECRHTLGEVGGAASDLDRAIALVSGGGRAGAAGAVLRARGVVRLEAEALEAALDDARLSGRRPEEGRLLLALAGLRNRRKDPAGARAAASEAARILGDLGMRRLQASAEVLALDAAQEMRD